MFRNLIRTVWVLFLFSGLNAALANLNTRPHTHCCPQPNHSFVILRSRGASNTARLDSFLTACHAAGLESFELADLENTLANLIDLVCWKASRWGAGLIALGV